MVGMFPRKTSKILRESNKIVATFRKTVENSSPRVSDGQDYHFPQS